jgi:rRNA biogenesis protein RRP5
MKFDKGVERLVKKYLPVPPERIIKPAGIKTETSTQHAVKIEPKSVEEILATEKPDTDTDDTEIDETPLVPTPLPLTSSFDWDGDIKDESTATEAAKSAAKSLKPKAAHKKDQEEVMRVTSQNYVAPVEPQNKDDFEQLILTDLNSSLSWIKYAAFNMEKGDNAEARIILARALKSISYREENEKLNVWIAYMNLELAFGSEESFHEIFRRAASVLDDKKVWISTATLLENSSKPEVRSPLAYAAYI